MLKFLLNIVMNNIFQGIILFILGILLLIYRIKYPTKGSDILAGDLNLTTAIIFIFIMGIGIIVGWMTPISF